MAKIIPFPGLKAARPSREAVRVGRVLIGGVLAEAVTLGGMWTVSSLWGRYAAHAASRIPPHLTSERLGAAFGPTLGAAACYLAAMVVARGLRDRQELHGVLVGVVASSLTVATLLTAPVAFRMIYFAACGVKMLAGFAGGSAARRYAAPPPETPAA